jgi:CubicO group peptidase (beta-lactamase class C family)
VRRSSRPTPLAPGTPRALPKTFECRGVTHNTDDFLNAVDTTGMLVMKGDVVIYENYWHGYDETTQAISWSIGKSFVSALIGIAIAERAIRSVEDPVAS